MKVPLSWLKDFVDITLPLDELAHRLTMAGLEVEEIRYIGLPTPSSGAGDQTRKLHYKLKMSGLEWDADKIVVGAVLEVMPHPNADRLVLCRLEDGTQEHIVLTGAPNLFPYKGKGPLEKPLKVAYAREGARIYDGHQPGQVLMTLKRARIRGVESYSMACSEKELGISDDHEGIIILDENAPTGMPLVDYMGDAVLDIAITPNIARNANILGVAREIAALTDQPLRHPSLDVLMEGPPIEGKVFIEIQNPELNPRFVLGLITDVTIRPSPYEVQRRLRLAGMRPINNIVDATNYVMLELGEPLHAFDYDVLVRRADGRSPTIITRTATPGERLVTLDDVERILEPFNVLVCDTAGPLSIAGVMGGAESEVSAQTRNVLLEGAAWNFINIRRTSSALHVNSEAAYRFARGVHPAMAERGVLRGLELMRRWSDGIVAKGLVDNYPLPPKDPMVTFSLADVKRWLGIHLEAADITGILRRLEFNVQVDGEIIHAQTPDHRLDIHEGVIGVADVMEEIARIYGYERIPETRLADALPPQRSNRSIEVEERIRDLLVNLGLQEVMTYRMTSPENEARLYPPGAPREKQAYVRLKNPIVSERVVMRRRLLASLMEVVERNARLQPRLALFEIGPIFVPSEQNLLPDEPQHIAIVLTGPRALQGWQSADTSTMDFYDLKGILEAFFSGLRIRSVRYESTQHPSYHPGKCAKIWCENQEIGLLGELHPLVQENYELSDVPILAAELNLERLIQMTPERYEVQSVPIYPPVIEDIAIVVDEDTPAEKVFENIRSAAEGIVTAIRLFDIYHGDQIGSGKKSLAYRLTYQSLDRTLTDQEVARIRQKIVRKLEKELGAKLRA